MSDGKTWQAGSPEVRGVRLGVGVCVGGAMVSVGVADAGLVGVGVEVGMMEGTDVGVNVGPAAGQTVAHAHVHVIPRYAGDVDDPRGGVRWVLPEKAAYWPR